MGVISWLPTRFHLFSGVIHIIYTQPVDNCGLRWVRRRPAPAQLLCGARVATAAKTSHTGARTWRIRCQGRAVPLQSAGAALQHTGGRSAGTAWSK